MSNLQKRLPSGRRGEGWGGDEKIGAIPTSQHTQASLPYIQDHRPERRSHFAYAYLSLLTTLSRILREELWILKSRSVWAGLHDQLHRRARDVDCQLSTPDRRSGKPFIRKGPAEQESYPELEMKEGQGRQGRSRRGECA